MKTFIPFFTLIISMVFIVSCNSTSDMLTVIRGDGSCSREFSAKADSAFLFGDISDSHNPFPVQLDSNWHISFAYCDIKFPLQDIAVYDSILKQQGENREIFTLVARRDYNSVDEMAALFRLKESHTWSNWKIKYAFEKKFRWFYTYFHYRETYPKIEHTLVTPPMNEYFTQEEELFWFTGKPDLLQGMNGLEISEFTKSLEEKQERWWNKNAWNAAYKVLIDNYDKIKQPPVSKERLVLLRDSIFLRSSFQTSDFKWNMEQCLNDYFHTKHFSDLWNLPDSPMKKLEENYDEQDFMKYFEKSFVYKLLMPGTVRQTSNAVIQNDTLIWQLTAWRMVPSDYSMEAYSRKTNSWAFVLTGVIFVVAIAAFRYRNVKRKILFRKNAWTLVIFF